MISTKGRYAIRVMIDLAENIDNGLIPLKDIAERQDISKKYLEIIVKDMVTASGKGGGYKLSRKPKDYTILEILEATEGPLSPVACIADKKYKCNRKKICKTLPMWTEYNELISDFFGSKKLSDILEN